jgi:hypothetical protein
MIGYWLLPAESERAALDSTIRELAQKHDAPVFAPHVTVYSSDDDEDHAQALVARLGEESSAIDMRAEAVAHSEEFTKTLFVQFARNPAAQQLSDVIRAGSRSPRDYELHPHLSLLYANLSGEIRAAEAQRIRLPFAQIPFDMLAAVVFPTPIKTRADVEAWRTIASANLAG